MIIRVVWAHLERALCHWTVRVIVNTGGWEGGGWRGREEV